ARIVLCGDISTYNLDGPPPPLYNIRYLMGRRARMEGFSTLDLWDHYDEAMVQLKQWLADGTVSYRTDMLEGVDRAPEALVRLFTGDHLGKLIINVAPQRLRLRHEVGFRRLGPGCARQVNPERRAFTGRSDHFGASAVCGR